MNLFDPFALRAVSFRNRIGVSPMCQYSAENGMAGDWHLVHLGARAVGGAGLVLVEATAVEAIGRISPGDLGLWSEEQVEPLARLARFLRSQGAVAGVQLAHAGRKASTSAPWEGGRNLSPAEGGWDTLCAPSPVAFDAESPVPQALDEAGLRRVIAAFAEAAARAVSAGFQVIEIHAAHGYLLHEFLSPLSNQRTDAYGGSFTNRIRLLVEVVDAVRARCPEGMPVFVRISATDWAEGGWDVDQSVELCRHLALRGVDLVDVSSGGLVPNAVISAGPGYQVPFAARIKAESGIPTAAVGLITGPEQADEVIRTKQADIVLLGRELLRHPYWPLHAAHALGRPMAWPPQYDRARPRDRR